MSGISQPPGAGPPQVILRRQASHFSRGDISPCVEFPSFVPRPALAAFAATSPAEAAFHLIRWESTGFCQICDQSIPTVPFPSNYRTVSDELPTFVEALAVKEGLLRRGMCKF